MYAASGKRGFPPFSGIDKSILCCQHGICGFAARSVL